VFLLGFDGDLYGARLDVRFLARVRDQHRYDDMDDLVVQIQTDVEETRRIAGPLLAADSEQGNPLESALRMQQ
jgi:riboflavin kinase/FMN adenylyltransferase